MTFRNPEYLWFLLLILPMIIWYIFKQYKKGMKGKFGLGLSIVKESVELYGYKIKVNNLKKGVLFEIE